MTITPSWLTYAEAGAQLGIKPASVKRRSIKRNWPRQIGNDGLARVQIPSEHLPSPAAAITGDDTSATAGVVTGDLNPAGDGERMQELTAELAEARVELAGARAEAAGLRDRLADAHAERDRLAALLNTALQPRPGLIERIRNAFTRDSQGGVAQR